MKVFKIVSIVIISILGILLPIICSEKTLIKMMFSFFYGYFVIAWLAKDYEGEAYTIKLNSVINNKAEK